MISPELALLDVQGETACCFSASEVIERFEQALVADPANPDLYLELAVLCFLCCDGGVIGLHQLTSGFVNRVWKRQAALLDEFDRRFGPSAESRFWRTYFRFIHLGEDTGAVFEQLARDGGSLVPYVVVKQERYRRQREALWAQVKDGCTPKERYLRSLMSREFSLRRRNATRLER